MCYFDNSEFIVINLLLESNHIDTLEMNKNGIYFRLQQLELETALSINK